MKNPNMSLAETFVSELARAGVREVCLAPGSRSTPLALAFSAHPAIHLYVHLDERCAAFFALGLAVALDRPVPVLCTSGSAAANFFPAIIEARMSRIPLLLLTADRPPELRESGANQTIDQVKLYGNQVLWSVDLPQPEEAMPALTLRHVRTLAARALARANGIEKGPIHLNFPFRKPLEPTPDQEPPTYEPLILPATRMERGVLQPGEDLVQRLRAVLEHYSHGLIVCGPRCPAGEFPRAIRALSRASGYPLFADPLSGVRFGQANVIGGYDGFISGEHPFEPEPEVILRFGGVPTSAALNGYLSRIQPAERIYIAEHGGWADDDHRTSWYVQADPATTCKNLAASKFRPCTSWWEQAQKFEQGYWAKLHQALLDLPWFDGGALVMALAHFPAGARVFVGNSLAVRNLDQFGAPGEKELEILGNRGTSGIDGNISTALGIAATDPSRPMVVLVGDITFYHDLNGLLALRQHNLQNVTILVFNNQGGGIFHRLPVKRFDPPFRELFLTPHELKFEHAAYLYGLDYFHAADAGALNSALAGPFTGRTPRLIEISTDSVQDQQINQKILSSHY